MKKIAISIPCFNEYDNLISLLSRINKIAATYSDHIYHVILVEDGSHLLDPEKLDHESLENLVITHMSHISNLGQGAALQTAFDYCKRYLNPDFVITMDADGQHSPSDIPELLRPLISGEADIVFGNRFYGTGNVPRARKIILQAATLFEKKVTKIKVGDAHNGFRAFNSAVLKNMTISQNRMAHATEIKQIVFKYAHRYTEVPVTITYTDSSLMNGQRNTGAFLIIKDLAKAYFFDK